MRIRAKKEKTEKGVIWVPMLEIKPEKWVKIAADNDMGYMYSDSCLKALKMAERVALKERK